MDKIVVFEGLDGAGKSLHSMMLSTSLEDMNIANSLLSFPGRLKGTIGEHIYKLHHEPHQFGVENIDPLCMQALHIAAHFDCINTLIAPRLAKGDVIILDRYWWSAYVYGTMSQVDAGALSLLIEAEKSLWCRLGRPLVFLLESSIPRKETNFDWKLASDLYRITYMKDNTLKNTHVIDTDSHIDINATAILDCTLKYLGNGD